VKVIQCPNVGVCDEHLAISPDVFNRVDHEDGTWSLPDHSVICTNCRIKFDIEFSRVRFVGMAYLTLREQREQQRRREAA
jgi:hypothetical protein